MSFYFLLIACEWHVSVAFPEIAKPANLRMQIRANVLYKYFTFYINLL